MIYFFRSLPRERILERKIHKTSYSNRLIPFNLVVVAKFDLPETYSQVEDKNFNL